MAHRGIRLRAIAAGFAIACFIPLEASAETADDFAALDDFVQATVQDGRTKAAIAVLARGDKIIWLKTAGEMAPGIPMRDDAILPLASIGKLYTATAAMILVERRRIALEDPVSRFLPEYADSGITIEHLMTHTAGLTVSGDDFWNAWNAHAGKTTTTDMAKALAALPRKSQPGERFEYGGTGASYEVLAAVIETASGLTLERFLTDNLFDPLGLADTFFYLPPEMTGRLPAIWRRTERGLELAHAQSDDAPRSNYFYGGGGIQSSPRDIVRFARLFLENGAVDGVRILSPDSVRQMMTDQLGDKAPPGLSWGFGAAVMKGPFGESAQYGWNGGGYATLWVDPANDLVAYFAMPLAPPGDSALLQDFRRLVYATMAPGM